MFKRKVQKALVKEDGYNVNPCYAITVYHLFLQKTYITYVKYILYNGRIGNKDSATSLIM